MKITIESTTKVVELNSVQCRIWEGATDKGVPVHCFIPRIAADAPEADLGEFERDLQEHAAPSVAMAVYPMRLIL